MIQFNKKLRELTELAKKIDNKGLFPEQSLGLLRSKQALREAALNSMLEPFSHHTCKECGILINVPRKWMIEHAKWHNTRKEMKENEYRFTTINPYR